MLWKLSLENTEFSFSLIVAIIAVIVVELYVQIVQGIIAICLVINGRKGHVNNVLELTMPIPGTYALVKFGIHLQLPLVFENSQIAIQKALLFCYGSFFIFSSYFFVSLILSNLQLKHSQLTFTCSKSAIETVEKDVKYVQS